MLYAVMYIVLLYIEPGARKLNITINIVIIKGDTWVLSSSLTIP